MVKTIKIGNLVLNPENGYLVNKIDSVGFSTKYGKGEVLKMHGAVLTEPYLLNKLINIELMIIGNSEIDLLEKKNTLIKEIKLDAQDKTIDLIFTLSNNEAVKIGAILKSFDENIEAGFLTANRIRLSFETESAFFKSEQVFQIDIPITKGGGASIPMEIPLDMTKGNTGTKKVYVGGNAIAYPEIYFYGPLTNPVLRNLTTNQTLAFSSTSLLNGEYLYVNTENRIIVDNLNLNKRDKMSGEFIFLLTGENDFTLQSDGIGETGYVKLIFRNFYKAL